MLATHRPLWRRGWPDLLTALVAYWQAQRLAQQDRARARAEWRSLRDLSDATLRDIGMGDRQFEPRYTLGVLDQDRGRWS
jgi:uncharacterized protein YjiS (DUF1127 family)